MAIEKINIEKFLELSQQHPVFDVRSPGEYNHAHIPGACSLPLFDDEERKLVGTIYKQQSRQQAIKAGMDFFGTKMRKLVEEVEEIIYNRQQAINKNCQLPIANCLLIHCWRGGMRSGAIAWLLDLYGFKVYTLAGGYKAFRNWVLNQFNKNYNVNILGGYTGSGKTIVLKELQQKGYAAIDLEGIANHKGSVFGGLGEKPQPSQEMFENCLALDLYSKNNYHANSNDVNEIWLEDESQRIGKLIIPKDLWEQMRAAKVYFLEVDFEDRLNYLITSYGRFEKEELVNAIMRIQKRLGGLETKNAINYLLENNVKECFRILLHYYDKHYTKGLNNRKDLNLVYNKIPCAGVSIANINNLSFYKTSLNENADYSLFTPSTFTCARCYRNMDGFY